MMLGGQCNACCGSGNCSQCQGGSLPDTVTVSFSGLTRGTYRSPDLLRLEFTSCLVSSPAIGSVVAPGGTVAGPISSATIRPHWQRFALKGRRAPTLTVTASGSGTGATFTPTLTPTTDACGLTTWAVSAVSVTGTTSGYADGDQLTFTPQAGDTEEAGAAATIRTVRTAPTITASVSGGTGATFTVSIAANGTTPETWSVTGVIVTNGGTGYPASGYVTFNKATGDTEEQAASAVFYCGRVAPTVTASVGGSGSGAVLSASLASATGYDGRTYWYISGISITDGGTGYAEYDPVSVTVTDGEGYGAYASVSSVDEDGAVTGIAVYWGGEYFKSNGTIESVEFGYWGGGGIYYRDSGQVASVTVDDGGTYYTEDNSLPIIAPPITVSIVQTAPSGGSGAVIVPTINSNPSDANFGLIQSLTVTSGGQGYMLWELKQSVLCAERFNGKSYVIRRSDLEFAAGLTTVNDKCIYTRTLCLGDYRGSKDVIIVAYRGPNTPPLVQINVPNPMAGITFEGGTPPPDCSSFSFTATEVLGGTASVSPGGSASEPPCGGCCIGPGVFIRCGSDEAKCFSPCEGSPGACSLPPSSASVLACTPQQCQSVGGSWYEVCPPPTPTPICQVIRCATGSVGGFFGGQTVFCRALTSTAQIEQAIADCAQQTNNFYLTQFAPCADAGSLNCTTIEGLPP